MNIENAKTQVKNALKAYLAKDEYGNYLLPVESQRPVFLMGPPGIGKTAIMRQIAQELGVGLVSYSMTHHTRQSALGLPYIQQAEFAGSPQRVSRYTMSEIIASVHDLVQATGLEEGILFLDEVNCVSETLAPAMLQFLQFKTFGQHAVPQGWVIVTAGNPPEYNSSVREFDIVTWDRLKRIDIEPDYDAWRSYALKTDVHPAVTTYLELKKQNFYKVEATAAGRDFVTARGWVDLSRMIRVYERCGIQVDGDLMVQYLQDEEISRDFANYYRLFDKYKVDYEIDSILAGKASPDVMRRAHDAAFDERLSVTGLVLDACTQRAAALAEDQDLLAACMDSLLQMRATGAQDAQLSAADALRSASERLDAAQRGALATQRELRVLERHVEFLRQAAERASEEAYELLKADYAARVDALKQDAGALREALDNAFEFFEDVFGDSAEMLIFVTDLTANEDTSGFIGRFGCDKYYEHNKELMFYERQKEIIDELEGLDL